MEDQIVSVTYYAEPGPQHTEATIAAALRRARELGLKQVIVASDTGKTARRVLEAFTPSVQVIVVTMPLGVELPVAQLHEYLPHFKEHKQRLLDSGAQKVPASLSREVVNELTQAGARVTRVDWAKMQGFVRQVTGIDRIGVATRVALVISIWSYLAALVSAESEVVALAGTGFGGGGADTAIVVRIGTTFQDFRVLETIARPRVSPPSE